jgi:hypothetical protein
MDERRKAFYEYHAAMLEPWDGPASIVFTDGRQIGATLDRNGLRPSRYIITDDDMVIMGSETGVLPIPESKIVRKWRLQPGKMFLIDLEQGRMIDDEELKSSLASSKPYKQWIETCASSWTMWPQPLWRRLLLCNCWTCNKPLAPRKKTSSSCWRPWPKRVKKRWAPWAMTAHWPSCPTKISRCTTTSSSCSRK